MTFPTTMSGHDRTYLPPRSLRSETGGPVTAWDLFRLERSDTTKEWASATLASLVAAADADAQEALGCTDCPDTGFYGVADPDDPDLLTGLIRREGADRHQALQTSGVWQDWEPLTCPLEVLDLDLAGDLAAAITGGACGLLRRYASPKAWLPPTAVVASTNVTDVLCALVSTSPQENTESEWVNFAVVDEVDQGAVLDLIRITASAAGDLAEVWSGSSWIPDSDVLSNAELPLVQLEPVQLSDIQEQMNPGITAGAKPTDPQQCHYCKSPATKSLLHSEGMAYIPVCDEHLDKGKYDAEHCTPDGTEDKSNLISIRDITAALQPIVADAPLTVSPDPRAEKLRRYWSSGRGGAKVRWHTKGDWTRCYRHLRKYMGLRAKGYCQNLHKRNNGYWTGDRRNRGLLSSAPEEVLLASVRSRRWTGEPERTRTMAELQLVDGTYAETDDQNTGIFSTVLAGGFPVDPPDAWFDDPKLNEVTPIQVTDDGRVFGHIAPWGVTHIGMAGSVAAPRNRTGKYTYFRTGYVVTASGKKVDVGQLTLVGGHAPIGSDHASAVKHYDDTSSAMADISVGEDRYGIWAAGALRPNVTPEQIRAMRACPPSGDWRPINGNLELVAACHVNVQGFPIAKARVASGAIVALVAAGARQMAELMMARQADPVMMGKIEAPTSQVAELVASAAVAEAPAAGVDESPAEALPPEAANPAAAATTEIEEPTTPDVIEEPTADELARAEKIAHVRAELEATRRQQLRDRMSPGSGAPEDVTAAVPPQFLAHKKKEGGDGEKDKSTVKGTDSFPIGNVADLKKAIQAYGRAGDKEAAKKHIISQAYKLRRPDLIPDGWNKK